MSIVGCVLLYFTKISQWCNKIGSWSTWSSKSLAENFLSPALFVSCSFLPSGSVKCLGMSLNFNTSGSGERWIRTLFLIACGCSNLRISLCCISGCACENKTSAAITRHSSFHPVFHTTRALNFRERFRTT